ncbi:MAG: sulfite exporter TauE/SafE family protein [Gammaproteobacteria bacterium]
MSDEFTLLGALIAGLLGGVHCTGMCGGIVSALSMNVNVTANVNIKTRKKTDSEKSNNFLILLFYNFGRISSYSLAGLFAGGVGWWLANWVFINKAQMILQIIAALFMLLLGLYLANWSRLLSLLEQPGSILWKRIEPYGRRFIPVRRSRDALLLGFIWGWLPCGLVYSMLIWSISAGSALQGGLLMLFFGIGTLPNLLLMGLFAQKITKWFQLKWLRMTAGLTIIGFAIVMLYRATTNF